MRSIAYITIISAALYGFSMASPSGQRRAPVPAEGDTHITTLVCERPATLATCKKDCDCPGDSAQPDCSEPVCHDNCRCRGKFGVYLLSLPSLKRRLIRNGD